ncbi:hypothetical protein CGLAUT_11170 [Corynebacterium glaucum]|nr:hypothetical protein CGLAUT_11170 [Corynebacterium glaucum]
MQFDADKFHDDRLEEMALAYFLAFGRSDR